jgi:hypothetical protein
MCDHDSSVELDQVIEDQPTPAISARLHKYVAYVPRYGARSSR